MGTNHSVLNMDMKLKLQKIISGQIRCRLGNDVFCINPPTPFQLYEIESIYQDTYHDAVLVGVFTEDELYQFMIDYNLWDLNKQSQLETLPSSIESLKEQTWYAYVNFQGKRVDQLKSQIQKKNEIFRKLLQERHQYDIYTASGSASLTKLEYILSCNVLKNNIPINIDNKTGLLKYLVGCYFENQLSDQEIRELSSSSMWRNIWSAGKSGQELFGVPAVCMTDEQKSLVNWSRVYNNVYESIDCPPDEVINDDILLDGWMIAQSKKRDGERKDKLGEKHKGKTHGASEVFIPVETPEDAQRIASLNSPHAQAIKRQRAKLLAKHGRINEEDMPDSKLTMQRQAMQQYQKAVKQ